MYALGIFLPSNIYFSFYKGIYPIINSTRKTKEKSMRSDKPNFKPHIQVTELFLDILPSVSKHKDKVNEDVNWPGLCTSSESNSAMPTVCPTSVHSSRTDPKLYFTLCLWIQTPEGRRLKWLWATSAFLSAGLPEGWSSIPGDSDHYGK